MTKRVTSVLILILALIQVCQAASFLNMMDVLFGIGPSKFDIIHVFNGIKTSPEMECRLALSVKNHSRISILFNVLSPLNELLTENNEFHKELSNEEQVEILEIYFKNLYPGKYEEISGKAVDVIMTVLHREKAFDLLEFALAKKIIAERSVLIYYLKHRKDFLESIKMGIMKFLDITTPILVGKGILHVLAESGDEFLLQEIHKRLSPALQEKMKFDHFTSVEGNSILHSAVLSKNPKIIRAIACHFNRLCGQRNKFGMSPLKLALVNGNDFESIKALLDYGCVADGEDILKEELNINFYALDESFGLEKLSKWSPTTIVSFMRNIDEAKRSIKINPSLSNYYFMGLINSYRELGINLDRLSDSFLIGSPSLRSRSSSMAISRSQSSELVMKKSPSVWTILSNSDFNENEVENEGQVPVLKILENMKSFIICSDEELKKRVLKNLTRVPSLDFTGVTLTHFIQVLVQYADPSVLAFFVENNIDYYSCIRSMFKQFQNDFEKLVPFLNAIGFDVNDHFVDGTFPIHVAVQSGNLELLKFLIKEFKADLHQKTVYEGHNVLHYGLGDNINREMIDFILKSVPDLLKVENNFGISPIQLNLSRTDKFEIFSKLLNMKLDHEDVFVYFQEVNEIFNEILENWPTKPEYENDSKDKFYFMFHTCGSEKIARLLLSFVSKKLLKHFISEKTAISTSLIGFKNYEVEDAKKIKSRGSNESPSTVTSLNLSP